MTESSLTKRAQDQRVALGLPDHPERQVDPLTGRARVTVDNVGGVTWTPTEKLAIGVGAAPKGEVATDAPQPASVVAAIPPAERVGVTVQAFEAPRRPRLLDPIEAQRAEWDRYVSNRQGGYRHVFRFGTSEYVDGRDDR